MIILHVDHADCSLGVSVFDINTAHRHFKGPLVSHVECIHGPGVVGAVMLVITSSMPNVEMPIWVWPT